eukprot:jgi/Botrbrau1/534/Bobra.0010s0009.1
MAFAFPSAGAIKFAKMSKVGNNTRFVSALGPQRSPANRVVEASARPEKLAKVALLGAAGGIGQPTGLLLSMDPFVGELALYDIVPVTKGVAKDISHCNTPVKVTGYAGADELKDALTGASLVVIPAGVPRKPGMTRDDLFNINAGIVYDLAKASAQYCPEAVVAIISNPVNSTVPIAAEVYKKHGVYDPAKIIGVTTLDVVRANKFVSEVKGTDVFETDVPVVGGHAGITILPLLSQTFPATNFTEEEIKTLTERIQNAGTEVVEAKAGAGSATLSMAYAAARMAESILRGLSGEPEVYECAYVDSKVTELPYFASKIKLGKKGIEEVYGLGDLTEGEKAAVEALKPELKASIDKGVEFAAARE